MRKAGKGGGLTGKERPENPAPRADSLHGTTMRVYRYIYKTGSAVRVNELQRALKLSSPSVAHYHVDKLLQLGLIREGQDGYVIDKVVFENVIKFRRLSIPFQTAYVAFFAASLIVLIAFMRPPVITSAYFFAAAVIAVALIISLYETFRTLAKVY
jgi:predicted DNA-binding transcriptional regulator